MKLAILCLLSALTVSAGCADAPTASEPPQTDGAGQTPAAQPATASSTQESGRTIAGTVAEAVDGAGYTYLRLQTSGGEVWLATSPISVTVGERVEASIEMAMENFHSKALNRDFALIYFTPDVRREGESQRPVMAVSHGAAAGGDAAPMGGQAPAPVPPSVTEPMPPPPGGMTVADVWAKRTALAGKAVTVRGKVVKFNGGIMGRNWLHIQDGSGNADAGTHDLTMTTDASASVGDIITVTGTLAVDKDFGAGYSYPVILESATVVR